MEKDYLILKRAAVSRPSGQWSDDDFDVLANGEVVGRIYASIRPMRRRSAHPGCGHSLLRWRADVMWTRRQWRLWSWFCSVGSRPAWPGTWSISPYPSVQPV